MLARANTFKASAAAPARAANKRAVALRVRAEAPEQQQAAPAATAAPAAEGPSSPLPAAAPQPVPVVVAASGSSASAAAAAAPGFFQAMSINAPVRNNVPFAVNGRLAQLGVVSAVGCELFTHQSVVEQFSAHPTFVVGLSALIAAASFAPVLRGASADEAFGPLTPRAERFNSEAALLGFAALLILEAAKGSSLF